MTTQNSAMGDEDLDALLLEARTDEYGDSGNYNEAKLKRLIKYRDQQIALAAHIEELEMTLRMKGKTLIGGQLVDAKRIEGDASVIYPSVLEARLAALKAQNKEK